MARAEALTVGPSSLLLARVGVPPGEGGGVGTRDVVQATSAAWIELLGRYEWAWYCTHTFRDAKHPEAADKMHRFWVSQVAESYLGRNWRRKAARAPQWVRGLEWQKRDVLHYHSLMTNIPADYVEYHWRVFFWQLWKHIGGGVSRIDSCDGRVAVYSYLSKYVLKGGEIDLSSNLRASIPRLALA